MADPFLAEVRIFTHYFAPRGWAECNGQLLAPAQNAALYSLLANRYGGDGITTFALPNLQGRVPIGADDGRPGRDVGAAGGSATVTLQPAHLPPHGHGASLSRAESYERRPSGQLLATTQGGVGLYGPGGAGPAPMHPAAVGTAGASQPHNNMMPYIALNFCIALQGILPPRG